MICPLCQSADTNIISREVRGSVLCDVVRCSSCELIFLPEEIKNHARLQAFYEDDYQYQPSIDNIIDSKHSPYQKKVEMLMPYLKESSARLLEIGTGPGHFIRAVRPYVKHIAGLELNRSQASYCRDAYGVDVQSVSVDEFRCENLFDVVCCFQVIEHVPNPVEFLKTILKFVRPGGILAVDVPNSNEPLLSMYKLEGYEKFYFRKTHLFNYNPKNLGLLFEKAGIKNFNIELLQFYSLSNHLHWLHHKRPQSGVDIGYRFTLPCEIHASDKTKSEFEEFFYKTNEEYKRLLVKNGYSDTIWAIIHN